MIEIEVIIEYICSYTIINFELSNSNILAYLYMMACLFLILSYFHSSFIKMGWNNLLLFNLLKIFDSNLFIFCLSWLKCSLKEL